VTGKYAVITGASRGLGQHLAYRFWGAGYSLGLISRSIQSMHETTSRLDTSKGGSCDLFACDLSRPGSVQELVAEISAKAGQINVIVNNAAIQGPIGPLEQNDVGDWERTIRVNLLSPVEICRGLLPRIANAADASILNLSGGGATGPRANFTAYASAKAALVRFSETLAEEVRREGVTVNCIAPGAMKTAMLAEVLKGGAQSSGGREFAIAATVFDEGGASMDRVADLALFLSSQAARGITGKLVSSVWDHWESWPNHIPELAASDLYTLRRIVGRDRGLSWGDR
jgi:NAD(P)-dependent dehydrogenase (short-subunit alcohol dehydrogenase family)